MTTAALASSATASALDRLTLAGLLRHGFGSDYLGNWGRCAPGNQRWHGLTVFALLAEGSFRYEPETHRLLLVTRDDLRGLAQGPQARAVAVVELVYVADCDTVQTARDEEHGVILGCDPGSVAERIEARAGEQQLHAAVHGMKERRRLGRALGLGATQVIAFAQALTPADAPRK
jgi:hypothetical protein